MFIQQDLSRLWRDTVANGSIANRFSGSDGRPVEIGLRLVGDRIEHYAKHVDTGELIGARIEERLLSGSDFSIEWNQYRALKPHIRVRKPGPQPDISPDVASCHFACQDPEHPLSVLKREPLLQLALPRAKWVAFYNAVPVEAQGHFLWVPVQSNGARNEYPHELQVLDEASVEDFVALAHASSGTATLYNSLHAGASVNHIHFHSVHEGRTGPLIRAAVKAFGAYHLLWDYPATGLVFDADPSCKRLWGVIDILQRNGIPLNLIAVDKRVFVFPRNPKMRPCLSFRTGSLLALNYRESRSQLAPIFFTT